MLVSFPPCAVVKNYALRVLFYSFACSSNIMGKCMSPQNAVRSPSTTGQQCRRRSCKNWSKYRSPGFVERGQDRPVRICRASDMRIPLEWLGPEPCSMHQSCTETPPAASSFVSGGASQRERERERERQRERERERERDRHKDIQTQRHTEH